MVVQSKTDIKKQDRHGRGKQVVQAQKNDGSYMAADG
jgi:hypothetical protein